jgi:hypothetical protein
MATTFCNPLELPYFIQPSDPCRREAADPVGLVFRGDYYIFASKSNGYWWSSDFRNWTLVTPPALPLEAYAPAVLAYEDALYFMASEDGWIYRSDAPKDPASWRKVGPARKDVDPALFLDDDGRVYLYYGCSDGGPISGVELDPKNNFQEIGAPVDFIWQNRAVHGWEQGGEANDLASTWIEGSWMSRHGGRYYLQYAAPGTQWKTYGDGVYVADAPLGPFTYAESSPFSYKPSGFIAGAGHGSTFPDKSGRWWHLTTGAISVAHMFERRLVLFPVELDAQGRLFARTEFGDYPQFLPDSGAGHAPGWMQLSAGKPVTASSALDGHPPEAAVEEESRTWWSAATKAPGEWLQVDLGPGRTIHAVQVNFAEEGVTARGAVLGFAQRYRVEISDDGTTWRGLIDQSANTRDVPHAYHELAATVQARFVRIVDVATPGGGYFSLRGLRVFGRAEGKPPGVASGLAVHRHADDPRRATLTWSAVPGAQGYLVRGGVAADALYLPWEVWGKTTLSIGSLNANTGYSFTVAAFNEAGVGGASPLVACGDQVAM